ncbi:hypothetical protein V1517DRAFT_82536 [Lipomyces orientalis]|uniref:Uncharacterized protein n=1 Tax=Lipomyces orientalis TaxID=1233043 RepID=A0ACC3TS72_9ASCO
MEPWDTFASPSSPEPASSAWSLGDVIPDWSDATLSPVQSSSGNGSVARSVQSSATRSQPTAVEDNENDPWATAVSPPSADAFTQVVLPEPKILPQVEGADMPLTSSESKPDQVPVNDDAEIVHSSTVADAPEQHATELEGLPEREPEGLPERVFQEIKTSLRAEDNIGKDTLDSDFSMDQKSNLDKQGNKMEEEDIKVQHREREALQQQSDKTETAETPSHEHNDISEPRSRREANDNNSNVNGDMAEKANGKTDASSPILIDPAGKSQDEMPESIGTTNPGPQEWEASQPYIVTPAAEIGVPMSSFAESAGFGANYDDLTFSNPFAQEPEKAPPSINELLPDIFPLPTVIDNERDSIANYFSDSQVAPPPLLSFGKARKLNAMFTRPTRQFFTPTPRISIPSQPSSPASSVNTSTSQPGDGIRVKWKHTEIQSRVQNVVEVWKNKRKDIGGMFDWDNADALGPASPTNAFVMDSMATGSVMDRGPPSPRLKRMFSSGTTSAGAEAPISFNWQDDVVGDGGGTGVWGGPASSRSPVEAQPTQPQPVFSQTASIPTLQPVAVRQTLTSQSATITQEDDNVDDWGRYEEDIIQ